MPLLEKECGIFMNDNIWYLCRAEIPMSEFEDIDKANEYANLIIQMMYSPLDLELRTNHYSPFSFVMAMQSVDTFFLYFYKHKYFDSMRKHWLYELYHCRPIDNAAVLIWPVEYHNWDGIMTFDKVRGYNCSDFYEGMSELTRFFGLLGIDRKTMEIELIKKLKKRGGKTYNYANNSDNDFQCDFDEDAITDE